MRPHWEPCQACLMQGRVPSIALTWSCKHEMRVCRECSDRLEEIMNEREATAT